MAAQILKCPKCGDVPHQDSVDIGVGIMYGPASCGCGWVSEVLVVDKNKLTFRKESRFGVRWSYRVLYQGCEIAHAILIAPNIIDILDVKPECSRQGIGRELVKYIYSDVCRIKRTKLIPFAEDDKAKGFWDKMREAGYCTAGI